MTTATPAGVELLWVPLGAGASVPVVRLNGLLYERLVAAREHRAPRALYHSALEVVVDDARHVVEMTPAWGIGHDARGTVASGPVGLRALGRSRLFRYEVHCSRDGVIPDRDHAVGGPHRLSSDEDVARRLLALVPEAPTAVWGRDELGAGDMWNSNSLVAWLLARTGLLTADVGPPDGGRAPGWTSGLALAARAGSD